MAKQGSDSKDPKYLVDLEKNVNAASTRLAVLTERIEQLSAELQEAKARLDELEKRPDPAAAVADLADARTRLEGLEEALTSLLPNV